MSDRDILKSTLAATPNCLSAEQLEPYLDGKASHPHLAECPRCQGELALLKSFESASPLADEGAAVAWISAHLDRRLDSIKNPGARSRAAVQASGMQASWLARTLGLSGWRLAIPVVGVVTAAILVAFFLHSPKEPQLRANNMQQQSTVYRSQEIDVTRPAGTVSQAPRELEWATFVGAQTYKVAMMEVDHKRRWAAETQSLSVEIPAAVRAKIVPGKSILWQVTAVDAQGKTLASSQVQRFSIPLPQSSESKQQTK
jgi:hypothetical protein